MANLTSSNLTREQLDALDAQATAAMGLNACGAVPGLARARTEILSTAIVLKLDLELAMHPGRTKPELHKSLKAMLDEAKDLIRALEALFGARNSELQYFQEMARRTGALVAQLTEKGVDPRSVTMGEIAASPALAPIMRECNLSVGRDH